MCSIPEKRCGEFGSANAPTGTAMCSGSVP